MGEYAYQKKTAQPVQAPKAMQADRVRFHSVPNSLFVGQDDRIDSNLGALMRERVAALQRQIPSAEREADRLSQGITATTPEGVRQQMGEKLGADFSNVRMYTDQSAANKADRMGAKAYTSGQNVYFGSGGFVPQVAAHELVHTVQQGAVEGVGVQQSVSFGTVQMCPDEKGKTKNSNKTNPRKEPGTASGGENKRNPKKMMHGSQGNIGIIPKQVADNLRGKQYENFDQFRQDIWREIGNSEYAQEFAQHNIARMKKGLAPVAVAGQQYGKISSYVFHHKNPIHNGGGVYDFDNMIMLTPRMHQAILDPKYHFNK